MDALEVSVHDRIDALPAEEWDGLCLRMRQPAIYHSHAWLSLWLRHFGAGAEPRLLVARRDGALVALCPLAIAEQPLAALRRRVLTCLGGLSPAASQYLGPICPAEDEAEAIPALARAAAALDGFDAYYFEDYLSSSLIKRLIGEIERHAGGRFIHWQGALNHIATLRPAPEAFLGSLPRKMRRNIHNARKRFFGQPGALIERVADPEQLDDALAAFCRQSIARLRQQGLRSTIEDPSMEQFFGAMTHRFQDLGRDAYYVARLGNQIVGTLFAIHFGPWIGYYNGSFDIQHKELSIGTLLIEAMFRHAIEHGFKELDMLAGSSSYKHRWAQCRGERLEYAALPRARLKCLPFTIWETIKSHSRCRA